MKATILASHAVFAPTSRFREVVPSAKPFEVISGCMRVPPSCVSEVRGELPQISEACPFVLLFSGKIECEHGVDVLAEAIRLLDGTPEGKSYVFHICGSGRELPRLREAMAPLKRVRVNIHGFVSNQEFATLFESAEACVVLQRPKGRQSHYKTPSKGYEAMCAGKTLLVSEIGDFGALPHDVCVRVNPYTAEQLASQIAGLTRDKVRQYSMSAASYARVNWDSGLCGRRIVAMLARHRSKEEQTA